MITRTVLACASLMLAVPAIADAWPPKRPPMPRFTTRTSYAVSAYECDYWARQAYSQRADQDRAYNACMVVLWGRDDPYLRR